MKNANASPYKSTRVAIRDWDLSNAGARESELGKGRERLLATIKRYTRVFTINPKVGETYVCPTDSYRREITAQEKAEFWFHTLLGR